ncbi:MAG: DUF2088 domain-containing protein [Eggerthellaceae bacterium]|nr:DUF2088 domain-containing protein [Eggerthellaceae bacterium]
MQFIDFPPMNVKVEGLDRVRIPRMVKARQIFDSARIDDVSGHIRLQMEANLSDKQRFSGKRLAITVGSRGILSLDAMVRTVVEVLQEWGAQPFIVPAMGSHGGATAEGQLEMLATYNVTEASMGCPILSSMDVVQISTLPDGTPVYCDKNAAAADGIVILNKVKPHTDFRAKHESGLAKMMAIGLAKHKGAAMFHEMGFATFAERIPQVCDEFLAHLPIAFGVGIVQNAYDDISDIEVMEADRLLEKDAELLEIAKAKMARFLVPGIDVLMIDEIGKNISGNGADPNITGRSNSAGFDDILDCKKLFIRGLTEETHHNGCGIAHADITTRRCLNDIDFETTWINVVTATMLNGGKIPMYMENDYDALRLAIRTCNGIDFAKPRIVHVLDTLHLDEIALSETYLDVVAGIPEIELISDPYELEFDGEGFLVTGW